MFIQAFGEAARGQFNAFVHESRSAYDGVVDQDTETPDPGKPSWLLPTHTAAIIFMPAMRSTRR